MREISRSKPAKTFIALLVVSALYYVVAGLALHPARSPAKLETDAHEYFNLSTDLLRGDYSFNARRTPFYPAILAFFRVLTGDRFVATELLAGAFFSLCAPLTYVLVRRTLGDERVAIVAAALTIVWPPYIAYSSMLYSETVALPFFLLFLILLPRGSRIATEHRTLTLAIVSGVALAWCMLLRPMYLLFVPFIILIIVLEERRYAVAGQRLALVLIGCFGVLAPWAIYSTQAAHMPILISANGGETLAGGLNPALIAQGFRRGVEGDGRKVWTGPGKWILPQQTGYLSPQELELSYTQRDALLRRRSMLWIEQHPLSALSLEKAKLLYMWGFYPLGFNLKETLLGDVPVVLFIGLAFAAVVRARMHLIELSRFIVLPFFVSLVALISWGSWRFRQPGDIGLLVLGAIVIVSLVPRRGDAPDPTPPSAVRVP